MGSDGIALYVQELLRPIYTFIKTVWPFLVFPIPLLAIGKFILSKINGVLINSREKSEGGTDCSLLFCSRKELMDGYEDWKAGDYMEKDSDLDIGWHDNYNKSS